jgi:hypothetical protein
MKPVKPNALRALILLTSLVLGLTASSSLGQSAKSPDSSNVSLQNTSLDSTKTTLTAPVPVLVDSTPRAVSQDSSKGPRSRADTVLVVKHSFNHREQIITGGVMMACLALILAVMNNYNPR